MHIEPKREELLIKPKDIKPSSVLFEVVSTINPAAIRLPSGDILLYVRVIEKLKKPCDETHCFAPRNSGKEKLNVAMDKFSKKKLKGHSELDMLFPNGTKRLTFISHFRRVLLDPTGFKIKAIDPKPSFHGLSWDGELGVEDPRITKLDDTYAMTYVSLSRDANVSTSLAISNDGINWFRRGLIFEQQNKDVVIFPEKINNTFYAFNRPEGNFEFSTPRIWISKSHDLEIWGKSKPIILSKKEGDWDAGRVGSGPPPLKTDKGWLLIYHGVTEAPSSTNTDEEHDRGHHHEHHHENNEEEDKRSIYSAGVALFDLHNPEKLIAKTPHPIIEPTKVYEKGILENKDVVFPTGLVLDNNPEDVLLFSGGGDIVTTVKKYALSDLMNSLVPIEADKKKKKSTSHK